MAKTVASTSLHQAIYDATRDVRKLPAFKKALEASKDDVNEAGRYVDRNQNLDSAFPLQIAGDKLQLVQALLDAGANPHAGETTGHIRVRSASAAPSDFTLCHILKRDASTALFEAIQEGRTAVLQAMLSVLSERRASATRASGLGGGRASRHHTPVTPASSAVDEAPILSVVDADGDSILHEAVRCERLDYVQMLLSSAEVPAGADVVNKRLRTPLHSAARRGLTAIVQELLDAGADASAADVDGDTPLSDAYSTDAPPECIELLLRASNASTNLATDAALLYIPFSPAPNPGSAPTKPAPSTPARLLLETAYGPRGTSEAIDCSICCTEIDFPRGGDGSDKAADQVALTECGHTYHLECWQQVVAHAGTAGVKCPNCRDGLTLRRAAPLTPPAPPSDTVDSERLSTDGEADGANKAALADTESERALMGATNDPADAADSASDAGHRGGRAGEKRRMPRVAVKDAAHAVPIPKELRDYMSSGAADPAPALPMQNGRVSRSNTAVNRLGIGDAWGETSASSWSSSVAPATKTAASNRVVVAPGGAENVPPTTTRTTRVSARD